MTEHNLANLAQLEAYADELAAAVKSLSMHCQQTSGHSLVSSETPGDVRRSILASIFNIQKLLAEPTDFLGQLASQVCFHSRTRKLN